MTYDDVQTLKRFQRRRAKNLTLIADPKSDIIRKFSLLNEQYSPGSYSYGVAHPITLVLDNTGKVIHRFSEAGYYTRPSVEIVLRALRSKGQS